MPKFCVQALVSSVPGSTMNVLPCFVELGRPLDVLPAGQGRASTRFPRAQQAQQAQRAHTQSTSTGIAGAVLGGLAIRSFGNRRPLRSLPKLTARVSILDIPDIPTEVDGDSCTPPWKSTGAAEIADEVLEGAGGADYVMNLEGKKVRGCLKGAKQVATLGPASASDEMLERLFLSGVDTFRLNFSHGDHEEKTDLIKRIRRVETKYRHPIGILADMQGPKLLSENMVNYRPLFSYVLTVLICTAYI